MCIYLYIYYTHPELKTGKLPLRYGKRNKIALRGANRKQGAAAGVLGEHRDSEDS